MKKKNIIIIAVIILLAVFFILRRKIELAHAPVVGQQPVMVHTVFARKQDISEQKEYLAQIQALRQANVSARINAVVKNVLVDESSLVKKGDVLAKLDSRDLEAKLSAAKAMLLSAEENLSYWKTEYGRDENLFANGAISEEERDRAKNSLAQAQSGYTQAKENVNALNANLSYAEIIAPFDGIVARRMVDPGDLAAMGKPLFVVNDQSRLKLVFAVPQDDLRLIKKGQKVLFKNGQSKADVSITNIFPSLEKGKVVTVEAYLKAGAKFLAGEFVPVKVVILEKKDVTVIPKGSLMFSAKGEPFIFVVKDNKLKKVEIKTGITADDWVEVKNISAGESVVEGSYLSGSALSEGQVVSSGGKK